MDSVWIPRREEKKREEKKRKRIEKNRKEYRKEERAEETGFRGEARLWAPAHLDIYIVLIF